MLAAGVEERVSFENEKTQSYTRNTHSLRYLLINIVIYFTIRNEVTAFLVLAAAENE